MSSNAQINANRANSQKSTGPRTPEGKAASSNNRLKHGIYSTAILLPNEDPDAYQALVDEAFTRTRARPPVGPPGTHLPPRHARPPRPPKGT